ncbi:MAG: CUAEP/CCAEP-tail radical SAM protein [Acidimicrobiia bacterium]
MRILLVSTYELGHQPLHVASPAARLMSAGHEVRALDLAVDDHDPAAVAWAEAVAISVPMHTAMRMAVDVAVRIRADQPGKPVAVYGLYAAVGADRTLGPIVDAALVGEYEPLLLGWVDDLTEGGSDGPRAEIGLSQGRFEVPARHLLPGLDRYAHLDLDGELRPAGYVEASHGCRHRCRHCPIPVVYGGRFRVVDVSTLLADVDQLVAMGARHVTLGDPDFLNGPAHAGRVLREVHAAFPELTFDVTVKVEHLLRHAEIVPELVEAGVLFAVSAFETVDDRVLALLDKGHTVSDMAAAIELCRSHGLDLHPSWLPFTPWTRPPDVLGIFRFLAAHDLLAVTDPVQLGIRLLVPDGSLILDLAEFEPHRRDYDATALGHRWVSADPALDVAQRELEGIAAAGADAGEDPSVTLHRMWVAAEERLGGDLGRVPPPAPREGRPRLTEAWFCCAEPTSGQMAAVRAGDRPHDLPISGPTARQGVDILR